LNAVCFSWVPPQGKYPQKERGQKDYNTPIFAVSDCENIINRKPGLERSPEEREKNTEDTEPFSL
jgi:hypothetical protein